MRIGYSDWPVWRFPSFRRLNRWTMQHFFTVQHSSWYAPFDIQTQQLAMAALERGKVVYFPSLPFEIHPLERRFLTPVVLSASSKNVGYNAATGAIGGTSLVAEHRKALKEMIARFAVAADTLLRNLLPEYGLALKMGRTSYRPAEIAGRHTSWRKDDTRLHVDAFPSMPTQGRRLLRVFCNVNPVHRSRTWRLGEPFATLAKRFWPKLRRPHWGERQFLYWLRLTRALRSEYDHYMLNLHDLMKADTEYQRLVDQVTHQFPAGSAWACFTDQVSHAAMAGQYQLEQTFTLPVTALHQPVFSPLRTLESLAGRSLSPSALQSAA
jgi:hypothetical protein